MSCGFNLVSTMCRHGGELHFYADDTHISIIMSFSPFIIGLLSDESTTRTFQRIESYSAEIRTWLKENKLMLNDDKKDVLVISSVSMRSKLHTSATPKKRLISCHFFSRSVYRNSVMDMEQQVQKICQSCYFHTFSIFESAKFVTF